MWNIFLSVHIQIVDRNPYITSTQSNLICFNFLDSTVSNTVLPRFPLFTLKTCDQNISPLVNWNLETNRNYMNYIYPQLQYRLLKSPRRFFLRRRPRRVIACGIWITTGMLKNGECEVGTSDFFFNMSFFTCTLIADKTII